MEDDSYVVRTINLRNPAMISLIALFSILFVGGVLLMSFLKDMWMTIILLPLTLALPLFLIIAWTSKIKLGQDYIERKSMFWGNRLLHKEIKLIGVYHQARYSLPKLMDQESIDNYDNGVIFISTNDKFDLDSVRPKKHIRFPFRKDLYDRIKNLKIKPAHNKG